MAKKTTINVFLLLFLVTGISNNVISQTYTEKFSHLDVEHGLSQSTVYAILQDRFGFMWFGTQDGLNKYDGYSFTVFKHDRFDSTSISNNFVLSIFEDSNGNLWIGTSAGLNRLLPDQKKFVRYISNPSDPGSLSDNVINAIAEDKDGFIWIGTQNGGLNKLEIKTGKIKSYRNDPADQNSISSNEIRTLLIDSRNNLWIGTDGDGLNLLDKRTETFIKYKYDPTNNNSLSFNSIFKLVDYKNKIVIATFGGGISIFDPETKTFDHSLIDPVDRENIKKRNSNPEAPVHPRSLVTTCALGSNDILWYGTISDGLYQINLKTKASRLFRSVRGDKYSLSSSGIRSLFYSSHGILWIGTNGVGINTLSSNTKKFNTILPRVEKAGHLTFSSIRSIYEDDLEKLYIGGYNGLNIFDRKTGIVKSLFDNQYIVYLIREDPENPKRFLLFGTEGGGLLRFDKQTESLTLIKLTYKKNNAIYSVYSVYSLLPEKNGIYYVGTEKGLFEYNSKTKSSNFYTNDPNDSNSINPGRLRAIIKDSYGDVWVGTDVGGISRFDLNTKRFSRYTNQLNDLYSLSNNRINTFFEDSKKRFWIGTATGLNLYNRENNSFTVITEKDGLPNNVVYSILEDEEENLWISTNKGISRFNYEKMSFENYDYGDGLPENEFNSGAYFKNKKGELFFGSLKGVTYFHPPEINPNSQIPNMVFTKFSILRKEIFIDPHISNRRSIELSYKDNILSFEFAAINFDQTTKNRYSYFLEGFNEDWIDLGNKREITFTNLDPGSYKLKIRGSNNDGVWNKKGIELDIMIKPPFWATLWFRVFVGLFLVFLIVVVINYRTRTIEKQKRMLEQQVKERTAKLEESSMKLKEANDTKDKFFSIIAHDLKNPFQTLLGFSEILLEDYNSLSDEEKLDLINEISNSSNNAHKLLHNLLQWSRSQTGTINFAPEKIELADLFETELLVLRTFATKKNIKITFLPGTNSSVFADRDMMATVFRNLVSNAIKFTKNRGEVTITISEKNDKAIVAVSDTGLGMTEEKRKSIFNLDSGHSTAGTNGEQGTGLGLILCKEFVEKNNGKIWVESKPEEGSIFYFTIPK